MKRLPRKDVVVVGLGWTGSIMALELCRAGLDVVAIERGPWRDTPTDFPTNVAPDELRHSIRHDIFLRPAQETLTFRNTQAETALPIRKMGSFLLGNGVGGSGVHWNGQTWRFLPWDFKARSATTERYGADFLPPENTIQDWPVSYEDLEPYYDRFEQICGTSGKAGNLRGEIQPGGNPFEGARQRDYPTPPMRQGQAPTMFGKAAAELGLHPFPCPSGNLSQAYTNPYGLRLAPCTYCGFCERFGCGNYSKASPQTCVLPALIRHPGFEGRTDCQVTRVNLTPDRRRATGVTYVDLQGQEWEQPADLVLVCAYGLFNTRLLLLSGIGQPYDPVKNEGVVGRNYAYQTTSAVNAFFDQGEMNLWAGAGAHGMIADDLNGDNFDHGPHGFVGGAYLSAYATNARPISARPTPPGTPRWGAAWKKATAASYNRTATVGTHGSVMSYRGSYLDLDPTYKDAHGLPLLRLTFDFHENELKMSRYCTDRAVEIARAMGAKSINPVYREGHYSIVPYQTTHNTGGTVMGDDPKTSVVNRYTQCWDVPNVFVSGASLFPQNAGYNPTGTVGALAYWALDAIRDRYLTNPGPLVPV